jgi:hypothetical protein
MVGPRPRVLLTPPLIEPLGVEVAKLFLISNFRRVLNECRMLASGLFPDVCSLNLRTRAYEDGTGRVFRNAGI